MSAHTKIRRRDAKKAGLRHYYTGKPCENGHVELRLVSTFQCIGCCRFYRAVARKNNPEGERLKQTKWRAANLEHCREQGRIRRKKNPEAARAHDKANKAKYADRIRITRKIYNLKHKDQIAGKTRLWRLVNKDKIAQQQRERYTANAEHHRSVTAEYRKNNPERTAAATKAWFKANPTAKRRYDSERKARLNNAPGRHTDQDIADILRLQRRRCGYCRIKLGSLFHVDHIRALSRGGANDRRNLQVLCQPCNQKKHAKDPIKFAQQIGRLL